jgi:hypothetical protein
LFSDSILAFTVIVLSTAAGIVGLYILPTAGIALFLVSGVGGLRLLLSYVRSPVGQHKDAGEGALTVAMVAARIEQREPSAERPEELTSTHAPLFTVGVINGYGIPGAGSRLVGGIPGPAEWIPPTTSEQTREIPAVRQRPSAIARARVAMRNA